MRTTQTTEFAICLVFSITCFYLFLDVYDDLFPCTILSLTLAQPCSLLALFVRDHILSVKPLSILIEPV